MGQAGVRMLLGQPHPWALPSCSPTQPLLSQQGGRVPGDSQKPLGAPGDVLDETGILRAPPWPPILPRPRAQIPAAKPSQVQAKKKKNHKSK